MAKRSEPFVEVAERTVRISSPDKPWFPDAGLSKLDVVTCWQAPRWGRPGVS